MKINRTEQEIVKGWVSINNPVASICCTTYNHEKYISDAIDGFLMQETDFPFEIIIRDDCSTDSTAAIVKAYAEKYPNIIKAIFEPENQYSRGVKPMSAVFEKATGKYLALCEGDDYWTARGKLQKQVDYLEHNPDHGLIHTEVDWLIENTGEIQKNWYKNHNYCTDQSDIYEVLITANIIATCTVCVRKSLIDKYQGSKFFSAKYKMGDYPMWLYISKISRIGYLDASTTTRRILEESASNFNDIQKRWDFNLSIHHVREAYMEIYPVSKNTQKQVYTAFNKNKLSYGYKLINSTIARESYEYLSCNKSLSIRDRFYLFGSLNKATNILCRVMYKSLQLIGPRGFGGSSPTY